MRFINLIPSQRRYQLVLSIAIVVIITGISYSSSLDNEFTNWDDYAYITENHLIKNFSWKNIKVIFTSFNLSNYHPLVLLSFLFEYHFFQLNPFYYHLTNVILHILNSVFLFFLFFILSNNISISFITALLFGIHPLHVESVAWVTERKDVLSTFFFIQAIILYLIYRKRKGMFYYFLSILVFIFSLLSKAMAVTLPVVLILFDYLSYRKLDKSSLLEKIPFFMLSIIFGILNIIAQKFGDALIVEKSFTFTHNLLMASKSLVFYLVKFTVPFNLSALYPYPDAINISSFTYYLYPLILLLALTFIIFYSRKRRRELFFGSLFFFVTILPVLKLIPVGDAFAADRYMYIPSIGLFFIIGSAFHKVFYLEGSFEKLMKVALVNFLCFIIIIFSVLTFQRNNIWQNSKTLWLNVLENYPESSSAHNNLGSAYFHQHNIIEAIKEYKEALRLNPEYAEVHFNLGFIYYIQNKSVAAIKEYKEALRLNPEYTEAHYNLGFSYYKQNKVVEAIKEYKEALRLNPEYAEAHYNLGIAYHKQNKIKKAIKEYKEAIRINQKYAKAHHNLGVAYFDQHNIVEAIEEYKEALRLNPKFTETHFNLGVAYLEKGLKTEAVREFIEVLKIKPNHSETRKILIEMKGGY